MTQRSDRPSALERLYVAVSASDLTVDPDQRKDVDYIIALGIAESRNGPGGGLARLYLANSKSSLRRAFESVYGLVKRLNLKRGWRLTDDEQRVVSKQSLMHHVSPACSPCHGRGYELQVGTPVLSTKICKSCRGSGRRPVQRKLQQEILQTIAVLENIDSVTESAVARLVR